MTDQYNWVPGYTRMKRERKHREWVELLVMLLASLAALALGLVLL